MRYEVCTVMDTVAGAYLPPFFVRSRAEAIRSFTDACNTADHQFHKHAGDYVLFTCGTWQDDTGLFSPTKEGVPERLVSGRDIARPEIIPPG